MSVGNQMVKADMDALLSSFAVQWRTLARQVNNLVTEVNGQGNGLAFMEALGYSSAANPANPGSISDAQYAENLLSYLGTNAGVYLGTATQGSEFDFDNALSVLWSSQV